MSVVMGRFEKHSSLKPPAAAWEMSKYRAGDPDALKTAFPKYDWIWSAVCGGPSHQRRFPE